MSNPGNTSSENLISDESLTVESPLNVKGNLNNSYTSTSTTTLQPHFVEDKNSTRITVEQFHLETTQANRTHLKRELAATITDEVLDGRAVELYRLGILSLKKSVIKSTYESSGRHLLLNEEALVADFDKCYEINGEHRQRWPELTGISELARLVHYRLQPFTGWSERETRRFVKGFFLSLAKELLDFGQSSSLAELGIFYCIPQGNSALLADQISQADVFLKSTRLSTVNQQLLSWEKLACVSDAWHPVTQRYGSAIWAGDFHLLPELVSMGYSRHALLNEVPRQQLEIPLALFEYETDGKGNLLLCSNGLRHFALESEDVERLGSEIILNLPYSEIRTIEDATDGSILEVLWIRRAIALAWVLLQSSKNKCILPGATISNDNPIDVKQATLKSRPPITALLAYDFNELPWTYRCSSVDFKFRTLVGLTHDEAIQYRLMPAQLRALLEYKRLDQEFRRSRAALPLFMSTNYVV